MTGNSWSAQRSLLHLDFNQSWFTGKKKGLLFGWGKRRFRKSKIRTGGLLSLNGLKDWVLASWPHKPYYILNIRIVSVFNFLIMCWKLWRDTPGHNGQPIFTFVTLDAHIWESMVADINFHFTYLQILIHTSDINWFCNPIIVFYFRNII